MPEENTMSTSLDKLIEDRRVLLEALKELRKGYVNLLEIGRDRIVDMGGECDPVDVMESKDPYLKQAKQAIKQAETP